MLALPIYYQMINFVSKNDPNIHVHSDLCKNVFRAMKFVLIQHMGFLGIRSPTFYAFKIHWRMPLNATDVIIDIFDMII